MFTIKSLTSKPYTWGELQVVHEIGNYLIVEYTKDGEVGFHPYVNGKDTNTSHGSLDKALIHAICCNSGHNRASEFINNMLRPYTD